MTGVEFFSEGYRLQGDLYRPANGDSGKRPGIVLCHGYTGVKNLYFPEVGETFAEAGFITLGFDYKGWGASEGARTRLAPHSRVADIQAAISFLSLQDDLDTSRIGLFGFSFGGSLACWTAAIDDRVKCIVSVVGVGDGERWLRSVRTQEEWDDLLAAAHEDRTTRVLTGKSTLVPRTDVLKLDPNSDRLSSADRKGNTQAVAEVPLEYVDDTLGFNPEWLADRIAPAAALFVTCENDIVVPPQESERLYEAAREPKKLVTLAGYGHYDVYRSPALEDVLSESLDWFTQHLGQDTSHPRTIRR